MATVILTIRRLWAQKGLSVATAVGLTAVVALMMLTPLYASGVYYQLLQDDLERVARQTNRSAFTYLLQYQGFNTRSLSWDEVAPADDYLSSDEPTLGLPVQTQTGMMVSQRFRLFPQGGQTSLGRVQLAVVNGLGENGRLLEGTWPQDAPDNPSTAIEVTVGNSFAQRTGVQIGDLFTIVDESANGTNFPLQIVGIWEPINPRSPFWVLPLPDFANYFVIPAASFASRIAPNIEDDVVEAAWQVVLDGSEVGIDQIRSMGSRYQTVENRMATLLPDARVLQTPVEALALYNSSVTSLVLLLTAFNVPILGLVLAFVGLVVGLSVGERRNEIAVMRSRGATLAQMLTMGLLEGVALGLIALVLGTALALWLTALIGHTRSFLDFSAESELRVVLTQGAIRAGLTAVFLALLARIVPTLTAARHTIITYKQDRARAQANPWWQRTWLDLLLMIPAAYGFYLLWQQNNLDATVETATEAASFSTDPLQNPLLLILPALTIFALTLFFLRLLPLALRGLSWLLAQSNSVGLLLAVRQLARTPGFYATPLILLILTVSLAVFTASLARTMDLQLFDQSYYAVGADVSVYDFATQGSRPGTQNDYFFVPATTFRALPGVLGAARVGRYETEAEIGRLPFDGLFLGVDRAELAQAAFWRRDFAALSLGTLLNRLAQTPNGILLPDGFMEERGLQVGDVFRQTVVVPGGTVDLVGQVVGSFAYFPSWYPAEADFVAVGNLDYLFQKVGGDLRYYVWLRTAPGVDVAALETALPGRREWVTPFEPIRRAQQQPERQGLFGLLSVGFVAAALLTVFGFFLYALFSFRRRFIELGVLRAVGLGTDQMLTLLAFELGLLIVSGLGLGTGLGVLVSQGFIPYLRVGETAVPPVLVEIAWSAISQIYILFGLLFLAALVVLGGLLLRMKIFQAVKLGETI
ncbi:MAG: FtsX-like permease family protein [Anaerolineales bacterium]|nr:FtsX-like permease family protein [Anaerolineales bacterium]